QSRLRRIACAEVAGEFSDAYCAGYLVGATDGDGTMREPIEGKQYREHQWYWRIAVSARQTEFIDRVILCARRFGVQLTQKGFDSGNGEFSGGNSVEMIKVETRQSGAIAKLSALWELSGPEFSSGYLAGIFDAEGSFGTSNGNKPGSLRISNTNGPV